LNKLYNGNYNIYYKEILFIIMEKSRDGFLTQPFETEKVCKNCGACNKIHENHISVFKDKCQVICYGYSCDKCNKYAIFPDDEFPKVVSERIFTTYKSHHILFTCCNHLANLDNIKRKQQRCCFIGWVDYYKSCPKCGIDQIVYLSDYPSNIRARITQNITDDRLIN
jgi:hypothetical protein